MTNQPSYTGPAMWISIRHRFGPRMTEWLMSFHTVMWGYVLAATANIFDQPAWAVFKAIFGDSDKLGWFMMGLGFLRIGGLIVNGARKNVTPVIRQVSAGAGFILWVGISYCFASSSVMSTWLAIYPLFAIGELVNINRAARDQGEARNGRTR